MQEVLNYLTMKRKIQMEDSKDSTKDDIINLYPTKTIHFVFCFDKHFPDSNEGPPPELLANLIVTKYVECVIFDCMI